MMEGTKRMETCMLVKNIEKYYGQYVATNSFTDKEVVSHGTDPVVVFNEAKKAGVISPVVFYIPDKDVIQIYPCL